MLSGKLSYYFGGLVCGIVYNNKNLHGHLFCMRSYKINIFFKGVFNANFFIFGGNDNG